MGTSTIYGGIGQGGGREDTFFVKKIWGKYFFRKRYDRAETYFKNKKDGYGLFTLPKKGDKGFFSLKNEDA